MKQPANKMARVLLVDDEPLALWLAKRCVEEAGGFVSEAGSCSAAEDLLMNTRFDLVVLDYRLGDGFGIDILRRMRDRHDGAGAVLLTAEAESIPEEQRRELAVDAVIGKPLDVDALRGVLEPLLKRAVSAREVHGSIETEGEGGAWRGRFSVVSLPTEISVASLRRIAKEAGDNPWLALDMRGAERMESDVPGELARLALTCREGRGRLCVILTDTELRRQLKAAGTDRELDVLANLDELAPAGRRLSADCERSALLDVSVRRHAAS